MDILRQTMVYAISVSCNLDPLWLKCNILSNSFPSLIDAHIMFHGFAIRIFSHVLVTIDGVWIGE
jgi:hypothetical protein